MNLTSTQINNANLDTLEAFCAEESTVTYYGREVGPFGPAYWDRRWDGIAPDASHAERAKHLRDGILASVQVVLEEQEG